MYHVCILRSLPKGLLYVGTTRDMERRLRYHNAGYGRSTAPYRLPEQIYMLISHHLVKELH